MQYYTEMGPYANSLDRNYYTPTKVSSPEQEIEKSVIDVAEMGTSVTEGRQGRFRDTIKAAINTGVTNIELAPKMPSGAGPAGVDSYGKEQREELLEMQRANDVKVISVHTPAQIGNLSGFNPERGFDDSHRKREIEEVKQAINFAAEATDGAAVVVHTGEYARPIVDQKWAKDEDGNIILKAYDEEDKNASFHLVDKRTGKIIHEARKSDVTFMPEYMKNENGEYIDLDGNVVDENNRIPLYDEEKREFKMKRVTWNELKKMAEEHNQDRPREEWITPQEVFAREYFRSEMLQTKGLAQHYGREYKNILDSVKKLKEAIIFYDELDKNLPENEKWKLMKDKHVLRDELGSLVTPDKRPIPELLKERLKHYEKIMESERATTTTYLRASEDAKTRYENTTSAEKYAKEKTFDSLAEAGIYAMEETQENNKKRDIFVAPENIFPEMGYGSHPEELIEIVKSARKKMEEQLVKERNISRSEAENLAERHIKATLDTQHLGMWWKQFEAKPGETISEKRDRFDKWYMEQVKKLEKENVIGHIHVVDAMGHDHQHLPAGQGKLPVKTAIQYLKEKGYDGTMISEAHLDGGAGPRQITKTWEHFGSPISRFGTYFAPGPGPTFGDVYQSYFGEQRTPYFVFGELAPSRDFTLWSQTPLE